jgi:hypothetical protein
MSGFYSLYAGVLHQQPVSRAAHRRRSDRARKGAAGHGLGHSVPGFDTGDDTGVTVVQYASSMTTNGAWFTLSEAAALGDRSRVTLRRYLDAGRFPNARQDENDPNRPWLIPLGDLQEAGVVVADDTGGATTLDPTRMLIVRLSVAEALADERAAEIERLKSVIETFAAQAAVMAAVIEEVRR